MKNYLLCLLAVVGLSASERAGFELKQDLAQYGGSDYANVVQVARGISLDEAFEIAEANDDIDYFVYLKGGQMVLPLPADKAFHKKDDRFGLVYGNSRIFCHGDTVFFKKDGMWLGTAPGLADTYVKIVNES